MSFPALVLDSLIDPRAAFGSLDRQPKWLLPLALLLGANALFWLWYYQAVDFDWLQQHLVYANPDFTSDSQRQEAMKFFNKGAMTSMTLFGTLFGMPIFFFLFALYFLVAGKLLQVDKRLGAWFGFAVWTSVPGLLLVPLMVGQMLVTGDGRIAPEQLNPLSLNALLFNGAAEVPWKGLLDSLSLTTLWSVALAAIGLQVWSRRSWSACVLAAVLPQAVIYGIWILRIGFAE